MTLRSIQQNTRTSSSFHTKWKPGDWRCVCNAHNFASRRQCYQCGRARPSGIPARPDWRQGDWHCDRCFKQNFAVRTICFSCGVNRKVSKANVDDKMKKDLVLDYISRLTKKFCSRKGVSLKKKQTLIDTNLKTANQKPWIDVYEHRIPTKQLFSCHSLVSFSLNLP